MKKRLVFRSTSDSSFFSPISALIGVLFLLLIAGGCSRNKVYIPPDKNASGTIILINEIYDPGFYVEINDKEAGYLKENLTIPVKPGGYKLKIFNSETSFLIAEREKKITHQFELKVKVEEGEAKRLNLSWEDEGYKKEIKRGPTIKEREKETEEKRSKSRSSGSQGPYPY